VIASVNPAQEADEVDALKAHAVPCFDRNVGPSIIPRALRDEGVERGSGDDA
jgi:hypothetical protein